MLLRILILVLLFWLFLEVFFRGLRYLVRRVAAATLSPRQPPPSSAHPPRSVEGHLVRCSRCGVRVPQERALRGNTAVFCSEACRGVGASEVS